MSHTPEASILEVLYEKYAQELVNWAARRFYNVEDAEDLCQEAMYRLYKAIIRKGAEEIDIQKIDGYLWKIAYSILSDYRQDKKKKDKLISDAEIDLDIAMQIYQEESDNYKEKLITKLRKSISQLNKRHREAMILFYFMKKNQKEIAEVLGVSKSYVKKLLFESRKQIRTKDKLGLYDIGKGNKQDNLTNEKKSFTLRYKIKTKK